MDEHLQEQASSYVLGALSESERAAFEQVLARDPELRRLVRELQDALGAAARSLPPVPPPPALKARVMAKVAESARSPRHAAVDEKAKTVPFGKWIPWLAAASLAFASLWLAYDRSELRGQKTRLEASLQTLTAEAASLREQARSAGTRAEELQTRATNLEASIASVRAELARAQSAADLANMQVARLASLVADQPRASAVSLWNDSTKQGVLLVDNMPALPAGKTYEFWVIDPALKAPVSGGIFATDAEGRGRIVFRPRTGVQNAAQFAISIEQAGGSTGDGPQGAVVMAGAATQL